MHAENVYGPIDQRGLGNALYSVSGFRSLDEFEICLTPGLNVFIGPNGSGKTNFIDFLDFLTVLVNKNVASAVSATGGVARVFSQESLKRQIPRIIAKISGVTDINPFLHEKELRKSLFKFEYEVDIRYSKFHTAVYIANEKIKFKNLFSEKSPFDCDMTVGSLKIHRFSPQVDEQPRWNVGRYLSANSFRNPLRYTHAHRLAFRQLAGINEHQQRAELLEQLPYVSPDESILSSRLPFPALDAVRSAIARGHAFNLNPQSARTPDDISTPPVVSSSGSGLTATIYQMQQLTRSDSRPTIALRRMPKDALDTVLQWTKLVMPDLQSISATADPHSGKYLVYLNVEGGDRPLKIPLQASSDGMLRWLAFACLIVSKGVEYTFEEPENYLHPKMQQYLIDLIRDSSSDQNKFDRYIISTHSETVINQCKPSEIVLFSFENGKTRCKRIANEKSLIDQVNETGFGLGYYYAMNALR